MRQYHQRLTEFDAQIDSSRQTLLKTKYWSLGESIPLEHPSLDITRDDIVFLCHAIYLGMDFLRVCELLTQRRLERDSSL